MVAVLRPQVEIRAMSGRDVDAVHDIERASYPFPWTRGIFQDCLRVGYRCHVVAADGAVSGYGIVSQTMDEAHLLNLCIHPERRRSGLAGLLLDHLLAEAGVKSASRMFLEVRPSNEGAVALYRSRGFRVIGRRPAYYPSRAGREDAMVMVLHLQDQGRQ
jgi:ribosomal-protein-alanine N-acetyltransferase